MFPIIKWTSARSTFRAIAVALVAFGAAGCSGDVSRFDDNPFSGTIRSDRPEQRRPPTPLAEPAFGARPIAIPRPEAGIPNSGRSAETAPPRVSAVRVAAAKDPPAPALRRPDKPNARVAKSNNSAVAKRATLKRAKPTAVSRARPAPPARKTAMTHASDTPATATPATGTRATGTRATGTRATNAAPIFQWPVQGKVLARFGRQLNGEKNDGINIAVPEDTPIKSAEDGVVIYAGNGLKGLGNLALVRHANNYVTVYAHAKELSVKRGDQIKRGEIIGKSGQTGNVSTPQIHFEVRKDSAPVNPLPLLQGGHEREAANRAAS